MSTVFLRDSPSPPSALDAEPVLPAMAARFFYDDGHRYTFGGNPVTACAAMFSGDSTYGNFFGAPGAPEGPNTRTVHFDAVPLNKELVPGMAAGEWAFRSIPAAGPSTVLWQSPYIDGYLPWDGVTDLNWQMYVRADGTPGVDGCKFHELINTAGSNGYQWGLSGGVVSGLDPVWSCVARANVGGVTINRTPTQPAVGPGWASLVAGGTFVRITGRLRPNTSSTYSCTGGTDSDNETYTGTSSRNGMLQLWFNGQIIMSYRQGLVDVPNGPGVWCRQGDVDFISSFANDMSIGKHPDVFNNCPAPYNHDVTRVAYWPA